MSQTQNQTTARRNPFARPTKTDGPRASFRQLLPFIFEHRPVLIWVAALSIVGAFASLAQPLLVSQGSPSSRPATRSDGSSGPSSPSSS